MFCDVYIFRGGGYISLKSKKYFVMLMFFRGGGTRGVSGWCEPCSNTFQVRTIFFSIHHWWLLFISGYSLALFNKKHHHYHHHPNHYKVRSTRVAKCHEYDEYIRVKIFAGWGNKSGRRCNLAKFSLFFWEDLHHYARFLYIN